MKIGQSSINLIYAVVLYFWSRSSTRKTFPSVSNAFIYYIFFLFFNSHFNIVDYNIRTILIILFFSSFIRGLNQCSYTHHLQSHTNILFHFYCSIFFLLHELLNIDGWEYEPRTIISSPHKITTGHKVNARSRFCHL